MSNGYTGMRTHADFKRALQTEGVRVVTLSLASNFVDNDRLWVGMEREVRKADTVGAYLVKVGETNNTMGSFLDYGKASEWTIKGDTAVNIKYGYAYRIVLPEGVK